MNSLVSLATAPDTVRVEIHVTHTKQTKEAKSTRYSNHTLRYNQFGG